MLGLGKIHPFGGRALWEGGGSVTGVKSNQPKEQTMTVKSAGPTIVSAKAAEAVAFYAKHFDVTVEDYGAGADCWYWTIKFGSGMELSFMAPQGEAEEGVFTGAGLFYYIGLASDAEVDAQHARMTAAGIDAPAPLLEDGMYQFWITDPTGLALMILTD